MAVEGKAMTNPGNNPLHKANTPSFLNIFESPSFHIKKEKSFSYIIFLTMGKECLLQWCLCNVLCRF